MFLTNGSYHDFIKYSETSGCEHPESVNTPYSEHFSPVPVFF